MKKLFWIFLACQLLTATVLFADDSDDDEEDDDDATGIREDEGVLVLTDDNFDSYTATQDMILVEFYAPWCGHCKTLAPEYAKAAQRLKTADVPVPLAKVDATVNQASASSHDVSGYPTLKFKKGSAWIEYDGPRDAEGIVNWIKEKADPNFKPPPEAVVTVTNDNFEEFISSAELVLVEFYAPWCGHCKKLAPEYEKAAKILKEHDPPIPLAKVDATVEADLAKRFDVTGYPTLKMFRRGRAFDYNGARDAHGISDYMHKQSGEAAKLLTSAKALRDSMDKDLATVVGFFDNLNDEKLRLYMDVANGLREDLTFGYSLLPEARDMYKVNPGSVVVFTPEKFFTQYEPKYHVLNMADKTEDDLKAFIAEKQLPLVGHYTQKTDKFYKDYVQKIFCIAFYTVDWSFDYRDATQLWRMKVAAIAKEFKDIKFAVASEEEYMTSLMTELGLQDSGEEFNLGCFMNGQKYRMEPMDEFDSDEIKTFLKKLTKGKLEPVIKSQPIPKKNTGSVKVVVGKTFEKIVMDKTKDVLLEIYAPWCGHCKQLEPIYKDLGKKMKKESNLVIAKIDGTANDIPPNYAVKGFPTIYFAPANGKDAPLSFDGDRTLDGFEEYLKKHATVSLGKSLKDEL